MNQTTTTSRHVDLPTSLPPLPIKMPNQAGNPGNRSSKEEKQWLYERYVAMEDRGVGSREDWASDIQAEWPQRFPGNPVPPCSVRHLWFLVLCFS